MDKPDGIKRKSTIAVFEHVVEKEKKPKHKKFRTNRFLDDDSPSESELVIDDKPSKKKKNNAIKLTEEPLALTCEWESCNQHFNVYKHFEDHLMEHCEESLNSTIEENFNCQWTNCTSTGLPNSFLRQHLSYHGYLTKLVNIGSNVLKRTNLPDCNEIVKKYDTPIAPNGYKCEWEDCFRVYFETIYEYYDHMNIHIKNNPRVVKQNDIIKCCWKGCNNKYPNQYKLAEHLRVHTKEKTVACPTCATSFSTKTKFRDHRKRQLPTDLQSYQCAQCLKLFASERLLRDHMRSHINHYKCTMCDMTCPKPSNLAKHIRIKHIKFKPFKCNKCDMAFVSNSNLRTHIMVHAKHYFCCTECDFKCKSLYGLNRHSAVKHNQKISVYECHSCKEKFNRGGHLTRHLMKTHNYHWPSGHTRFKYRQDQDGIFRLQTVRYESLEVTEEMIRSETMQSSTVPQSLNYNIQYEDNNETYVMSIAANEIRQVQSAETNINHTNNSVLITIEDVDEHGNVLNSEVIESNEFVLTNEEDKISIVEHPVEELPAPCNCKSEDDVCEFLVKKNTSSVTLDKKKKTRKNNETKAKLRTKRKRKGKSKPEEVEDIAKTEDIHYFSKEIIENYDKFKIVTTS